MTSAASSGYTLRRATPADAPALARLHLETLPEGVSDLSPLGESLVRHFYTNVLARGISEVRVAEDPNGLLGFVMVTHDISTMFPRALLASLADVVTFVLRSNPFGLLRAAIAKVSSGTATVASAPEIVFMGVGQRGRGRGLGAVLMHQGQSALHEAGFRSYQLNVHADNEHALKIHLARGFEVVRTFEKGGKKIYLMVCRTSPPPPL